MDGTKEEFNKYKIKISDGFKIELDGQLIDALEVKTLNLEESISISKDIQDIIKDNGIKEFTLKNIHISSNPELSKMLKEVGKNVNKIKIENCEIGNLESLMQGISGKDNAENIFLRAKLGITKFEYDKAENKMGLSADRTTLIKDFCEYLEPEKIDILIKKV